MKQISILLSYVFDDYLKTCKLLEVPSSSYHPYYFRLGIDATTRQDIHHRCSSSAERTSDRGTGNCLGQRIARSNK